MALFRERVTQTLRVLHDEFGGHFTFKGGTSLLKGYGLIERFSEDIDIRSQAPQVMMTEDAKFALGF